MSNLPRIAIGTIQPGARTQPMLWALLDVLDREKKHVQTFFSQARFVEFNGSASITGQCHRHLDSWLMTPDLCRDIFCHGTEASDLAIVGGQYDLARRVTDGGSLDTLCEWLDLPRLVIVDAGQMDACRIPARPHHLDGILLDRIPSVAEGYKLRTTLEALWGAPVIGMLETAPTLRSAISALPPGGKPARQLCSALGDCLIERLDLPRLLRIAESRTFPEVDNRLFCPFPGRTRLTVAVAYDEAFNRYFPDVLDLLEAHGAVVQDFSPLRSESLPPGTDLVYFGCGHAERYAERLAANCCLKQALINHVGRGRRVYAEGAGLAYLCQHVIIGNRQLPMTGILPACAQLNEIDEPLQPVHVTLGQKCWLGEAGARLRGYLNRSWSIEPLRELTSFAQELQHRTDLVGTRNVVASRLHLNFAAQPQFLQSFFRPHSSSMSTVL